MRYAHDGPHKDSSTKVRVCMCGENNVIKSEGEEVVKQVQRMAIRTGMQSESGRQIETQGSKK